jgi:rhodanese-related sulfurtransferase
MKRSAFARALLAFVAVIAGACNFPALTAGTPGPADPPKHSTMHLTHVDPAAAETLIKEKKAVVLDIRTPAEFKSGHIDGAVNLDFQATNFAAKLAELDRSKTYVVHCASGGRSTRSLPVFEKQGFNEVAHLDGGFNAWKKAGKPVK